MKKIIKHDENYLIVEHEDNIKKTKSRDLYVTDDFVKMHDAHGQYDMIISHATKRFIHSDIKVPFTQGGQRFTIDIKFIYISPPIEGFQFKIGGMSGDYGFNMGVSTKHTLGMKVKDQVIAEVIKIIEKEKINKTSESIMEDKKLRQFIRQKVVEFLTEQKILAEAEKEGKGKPTSGLTKAKVGTTHTEKTKSKNPPAKKVTDGGPENKTLADAEPTPVDNEVKVMKEKDEPKKTDSSFEAECMGVDLKVKGASHADINHLYLVAQVRKALEGKGPRVKKIEIEMGEKEEREDVKESVLRKKIRDIIKEQLKKKLNEEKEIEESDLQPNQKEAYNSLLKWIGELGGKPYDNKIYSSDNGQLVGYGFYASDGRPFVAFIHENGFSGKGIFIRPWENVTAKSGAEGTITIKNKNGFEEFKKYLEGNPGIFNKNRKPGA